MKLKRLLLLFVLLLVDVFMYTQAAQLLRQPSDASVFLGLLLVMVLIVVNYLAVRYFISNFLRR